MLNYSFKLPDLGEGMVESEIVEWRVQVGDKIETEQPLVDMMTDKATIEITSPISGTVLSLAGDPGDIIPVGSVLIEFATDDGAKELTSASTDQIATETASPQPRSPDNSNNSSSQTTGSISEAKSKNAMKPLTSPAIRKMAHELGVDLIQVTGTGTKGRITQEDIDAFIIKDKGQRDGEQLTMIKETVEIPVIGLRRKIAEKMVLSASSIPHFTYVEEVDMTELESLRQRLNTKRTPDQPKLSYLPFFMRALVNILKDFPQCNAHFNDETNVLTQFDAVHIGIATHTDDGLLVPVITHVEAMDLWQCATQILRLTKAVKTRTASKDELTGSTITISSLGALGGLVTTPIINHPEVAIISINKTQHRPVLEENTFTTRLMMNLSSSFDHRVVDGLNAARMIQSIKSQLEKPSTLLM